MCFVKYFEFSEYKPKAIMATTTRYFLFTRLRPKLQDYMHLVNESRRIQAFVVYKTDTSDPTCKVLKGLFILHGTPTKDWVLANNFPNFIITSMPNQCELDLWNLKGVTTIGKHPFEDVKRRLFKGLFDVKSFSDFMNNERITIEDGSEDVRTMVPSSAKLA